jgi:hypothetical protein
MNAHRSVLAPSPRLGLGCLALALTAACAGPPAAGETQTPDTQFAARSEASAGLGIQTWQAHNGDTDTHLLAIDRDGATRADLTVTSAGASGGPVDLRLVYPEAASMRLLPDGTTLGEVSALAREIASAVYGDLNQPEPIAVEPAREPGVLVVQQALTRTGSIHYKSNLFGHNDTEVVGPDPCPAGETRSAYSVRGRNVASRCTFDGWRTNSYTDCRIYVAADIPMLTSEDCDWEVDSN